MAPQRRKHAPIQSTCHPLSVDILLSYLNKRIPGTYTLNLHFIFIAGNRLTLIPLQRYYDNSRGRVAKCRWTSQYHSVASPAVLETIVHQKLARTATVVLTAKQSSPRQIETHGSHCLLRKKALCTKIRGLQWIEAFSLLLSHLGLTQVQLHRRPQRHYRLRRQALTCRHQLV